jgi:type IV pilus assembly protein PilV
MSREIGWGNEAASMTRAARGESGFTLIEVMLALMVLGVGLLGIAGMQEMALGRNVDAKELSVITNLAADMVERIRFNGRNVAAYNGIDTLSIATRPPNAQLMAQGDYDQWSARLAASGLRNVRGRVTVTAVGPQGTTGLNQNQVTVQVNWSAVIRTRALNLTTIVSPE